MSGPGAMAAGGAAPDGPAARQVLPDAVVPIHYDLALSPDTKALTFRGTVQISVEVRAASPEVVLNSVGLTFDHATVDGGDDGVVTTDEKLGRARLQWGAPLALGPHRLRIDYHGKIGRSTLGFFAMDYSTSDGPRRTLATNFEPAETRQLVPSWDEPGRKATFTVTVDAPKDRMAISNMPVVDIASLSETTQRVRFAETPKMSTYLLFLAVGDFERIHETVDGVDVGIVVKRGDTAKGAYALDQAGSLLHYYNDYFGIAYPLPKLDLIAAPGQLFGGSMENWGAIFYSQDHLLFDPATSTESDRQHVFLVVSHEMAHQWFGDLVTMSWWDDLWLNEGFARWMQTYAADDLHPEWETGLRAASIFEAGKQADSVPSTHAVVQTVLTVSQAIEAFDDITYAKGAAIISMINAYVGRDAFREGVRRYMRAHAFGNTADSDLWTVMEEAVEKPIGVIERDFTRQEGLPLVRVTRAPTSVHLTQTRFADDPSTIEDLPPQSWHLPLAVAPLDGGKADILLHGSADLAPRGPLLVNSGQQSYARVLYDEDLFDGLALHFGALAPIDQMGLLDDAYALGNAGYAPPGHVLRLARALPADGNPIVWQRVVGLLHELDLRYPDTPARAAFRRFALGLLAPLAARLGPAGAPDEASNLAILRGAVMYAQGVFGDAGVLARERGRFERREGSPQEQSTALRVTASHADAATFEALLGRAEKAHDPLEKLHLFQALGSVSDPALVRRMVDVALSDRVPAGAGPQVLGILADRHPDLVWTMVAPRLDDPTLPFDAATRWHLAGRIARLSANPQRIADLQAYEARSVPAEARKPFLGAIASIRRNERLTTKVLPELDRWIRGRNPAP
jgi:aminopeptidase N